jgi:hypothetical protein
MAADYPRPARPNKPRARCGVQGVAGGTEATYELLSQWVD